MSQEASKMEVVGEASAPLNTAVHSSGQKRIGLTGVLPRRGGRKKTLSLNPEEREALENLIEEVIIDGGMGDSESASSDEEDSSHDGASKEKSDTPNVVTGENSNDPKVAASFKVSKKFYPGQLKVALKHMTDLPPRFSRKLKRAEKYLEMTATQKKTSVSTSIKEEEEEEEIVNFNLTPHPTNSIQDSRSISPKQFQNDKVKIQKEKTQKDLKKTIRSLLTDLDQYVDEKERVSISMDLPGAVSCADLERETLAYSIKSSESAAMPLSSPDVEPANSKAKITGANNPTTESSNVDRPKCPVVSTKSSSHLVNQFNQPSTSKNYSSLPSPSIYNVPPGSSASKVSGNAMMNTKQPVLVDKNPLSPQYSNMTPTSYIDGNSIIMPVQPLIPQMPQIDFSVPPPSTYQFSPQYGIPSSQESYISGEVQYQTQYGYVELPTAGSAPTHAGINFVDTAPIIFQQFNTLPIASQHQQVSSMPYPGSPGYFLGRFNCQTQPLNYIPQFQTSSSLMNADSVYKTSVDRNPQKQRSGNTNVGNFRAPLKSKPSSNSQSPNADSMSSKIRPRNFQNYNKQDPMKQHVAQGRDVTSLGSFSTPPDSKTNQSNSIPHLPVTIIDETLNVPKVVFKINQNPSPPTTSSPVNPTLPPSTTNGRSSDCSNDSGVMFGVKTGSTTSDDFTSDHNTTVQSSKATDNDSRNTVDEFLAVDIDLGSGKDDVDDGDGGLDVVLGESFVKKLNEMFLKSDESAVDHYTSKPVFLSSKVLKEIFRTIASPSSPPS